MRIKAGIWRYPLFGFWWHAAIGHEISLPLTILSSEDMLARDHETRGVPRFIARISGEHDGDFLGEVGLWPTPEDDFQISPSTAVTVESMNAVIKDRIRAQIFFWAMDLKGDAAKLTLADIRALAESLEKVVVEGRP